MSDDDEKIRARLFDVTYDVAALKLVLNALIEEIAEQRGEAFLPALEKRVADVILRSVPGDVEQTRAHQSRLEAMVEQVFASLQGRRRPSGGSRATN